MYVEKQHFRDLRRLSIRQWISMLLLPMFFLLWAVADPYVRIRDDIASWTVVAIAILSFILALYYGHQISRQRGIEIGTQGLTGTFLVKPTHEVWAEKARKNVERYHEHHAQAQVG
ncbi:hypothetical protein CfE428DRAFT_0684 [Chthoniobacter flavus Ellin428]|uniref:Uncharacterized protein n=1 Tax=Chthoniobacter flavus Ellin428 TaxID=497964 RepID=B4CVJ7_9BACT|nr:hypothetical protein [Chthoniobacter flavus]EDY21439.1 hypothetical protein CfE428DRAFT_0684 [Chthoniobacter flavus Ellin428]